MIIKVCGLREPENIRDVENIGCVDWHGFLFYPLSPRYVGDCREVMDMARHSRKKNVGVFVNETPDNMLLKAGLYRLDYLQLHGSESPAVCRALQAEGHGVIKAFSVGAASDFESTDSYRGNADYLLFDTRSAGYGGSGKRFDWSLLDAYRGDIPFLLSGGITSDCMQDLQALTHPQFAGIDINSGFEISPGMKDAAGISLFGETFKKNLNR